MPKVLVIFSSTENGKHIQWEHEMYFYFFTYINYILILMLDTSPKTFTLVW